MMPMPKIGPGIRVVEDVEADEAGHQVAIAQVASPLIDREARRGHFAPVDIGFRYRISSIDSISHNLRSIL